jgi:ACS family hexuronate transporter-like MFS transporter
MNPREMPFPKNPQCDGSAKQITKGFRQYMGFNGTTPAIPVMASSGKPTSLASMAGKVGMYRWAICAMLFVATTINYMDRQVLGILAPILQSKLGWNDIQYGYIVTAFIAAYAIGVLAFGAVIDRIGTRLGYSLSMAIWSLAAMGHALVHTPFGFGVARASLGLGEAGNFPSAIKTVAEWFPSRERALATGIFNSGSNIGAIIAPLCVPWIAIHYGWRPVFILTGMCGLPWIAIWLAAYRKPRQHPHLSKAELSYIESDAPEPQTRIPWFSLFHYRQTWAFVLAKGLTDPMWWFFLYWLPKFLYTKHGLSLGQLGLPLVVIYAFSDCGSIFGGWLSSHFIKIGWTVNRARKTAMLIFALSVTPIILASKVSSLWGAVAIISVACASHQAWSANMYTTGSDMFPRRAVASIVGIGTCVGGIFGMFIASFTGFILQATHSYFSIFCFVGFIYLFALLILSILAPKLEPAGIDLPLKA